MLFLNKSYYKSQSAAPFSKTLDSTSDHSGSDEGNLKEEHTFFVWKLKLNFFGRQKKNNSLCELVGRLEKGGLKISNNTPSSTEVMLLQFKPDWQESAFNTQPNINNKEGFYVTSAVTQHALKLMGRETVPEEYISTRDVRALRRKSSLKTHPDKTGSSFYDEFIQTQEGYQMLLEEEYNPNELTKEQSSRRKKIMRRDILPQINNDLQELRKCRQQREKELEELEKIKATIQQSFHW